MLAAGDVELHVQEETRGTLDIRCAAWEGFGLAGLRPSLRMDGVELEPAGCRVAKEASSGCLAMEYSFENGAILVLRFERAGEAIRVGSSLRNVKGRQSVLNSVVLLGATGRAEGVCFGRPEGVRVYEQSSYGGRVRLLVGPSAADAQEGEPGGEGGEAANRSDLAWVVYDRSAKMAFLAGFETSERWLGRIEMRATLQGRIAAWSMGFDGGDLLLRPDEEIELEAVLLSAAPDPWGLLTAYGDAVKERHKPQFPQTPPVSWCSWYPYRLGVTEERVLENARIAAQRLKPLGLSIMEVDLGWEKDQLPSTFEENDQFAHGLSWLSEKLGKLGLELGVWKAPFTISEHDPMVGEHPEWLIQDESGQPAAYWEWFWAPHGKVFVLDLTHPGAQEWLRTKIESLAQRGVRYLKADFIGCVSIELAKRRHDPHVVAGGGTQAARIGARIIREALPDALMLNCGGPDMPGTGQWPLLYACQDTGNTGFISPQLQSMNHQALACHLFKNRRWGIIQPSCLCVGLPGSCEEARLRATAAFLAGGQIDISDTLTTLPEDRWEILTATLPPLGITAKPVDLFEAVGGGPAYDYSATCKEESGGTAEPTEHPPGSVWHVHVETDWDAWELVGVFSFHSAAAETSPRVGHFSIPLSKLGLSPGEPLWGYEFWSRQFLDAVPSARRNPRGYAHPGDFQDLCVGDTPERLDLGFFGPAVKLLCLRKARPHPWVVGTSFHQSSGTELKHVVWDPESLTLSGEVHRPKGETGFVVIAGAGRKPAARQALLRPGAKGSWVLPVTVRATPARWRVRFRP